MPIHKFGSSNKKEIAKETNEFEESQEDIKTPQVQEDCLRGTSEREKRIQENEKDRKKQLSVNHPDVFGNLEIEEEEL